MIGQHDNRYIGPYMLDLVCNGGAIQQAEVVFEDDRVNRLRHEKTQTIATVGRGRQLVSVFLQQLKLGWIPVYAQQRIGRHPVRYTGRCRINLINIAQLGFMELCVPAAGERSMWFKTISALCNFGQTFNQGRTRLLGSDKERTKE